MRPKIWFVTRRTARAAGVGGPTPLDGARGGRPGAVHTDPGPQRGQRRLILTGLVTFTLASLVTGLAQTQTLLLGRRIAQGVGAALLSPGAGDHHQQLPRAGTQQGPEHLGR
jgi:MFS family permease